MFCGCRDIDSGVSTETIEKSKPAWEGGSRMINQRRALELSGCEAFDPHGQRLGLVGQLFLDDATEEPAWVTVQSGIFGTNERFVPLDGAAYDGDTLTVAVSRDAVRQSPPVVLHQGDLLWEQEHELFLHYGLEYGVTPAAVFASSEEVTPSKAYIDAVRLRLRRWLAAT